jgi:hypothetical protein
MVWERKVYLFCLTVVQWGEFCGRGIGGLAVVAAVEAFELATSSLDQGKLPPGHGRGWQTGVVDSLTYPKVRSLFSLTDRPEISYSKQQ